MNCHGVIDANTFIQLDLVTDVIKSIKVTEDKEPNCPQDLNVEAYAEFFPALTLLLRDFSLTLRDENGMSKTPD